MRDRELDYNAWSFWRLADADQQRRQLDYQRELADRGVAQFAKKCFVSELAACFPDRLVLGEGSYVAAFAYLTGDVQIGQDSTINVYAVVRGTISIGNGVRIGAHTSILGFNHSMDPSAPVYKQPTTTKGITIGDDVWIGSNTVILDGVTVGDHSVIGAGAVVTKDVAPWSVMGGNPARRIRDRRGARESDVGSRLEKFARLAREQAPDVLDRYWDSDGHRFLERPGIEPTVRAFCDATEIADLLLGNAPPQMSRESLVDYLRASQDPETGLVPTLDPHGNPHSVSGDLTQEPGRYHILAVGHALELLGSEFAHPIAAVENLSSDRLTETLHALPWKERAWNSGDWIDCYGTGLYWNRRLFGLSGALDTLIGWLHTHVDRWTGMWGTPSPSEGRHQIVNGYYRLTRGSFAQFGLSVPYPEEVIDTVFTHTRDQRFFGPERGTSCDVLDVIHPLWLAGKQTDHRRPDVQQWAKDQLDRVLSKWQPGAGFSFGLEPGTGRDGEPGLQGTEMWLAILWHLADVLGMADALGYTPRGVHRPSARWDLATDTAL